MIALLREVDGGGQAGAVGGDGLALAAGLEEGEAEAVVDHGDVGVLGAEVRAHELQGLLLEADGAGDVVLAGEVVAVEAEHAGEVDGVFGLGGGEQAAGVGEGGAGLGAELGVAAHGLGAVGEGAADRAGAGVAERVTVAGGVELGVAQPVRGGEAVAEAATDDVGEAGGGVDRDLGVAALDGEEEAGLERGAGVVVAALVLADRALAQGQLGAQREVGGGRGGLDRGEGGDGLVELAAGLEHVDAGEVAAQAGDAGGDGGVARGADLGAQVTIVGAGGDVGEVGEQLLAVGDELGVDAGEHADRGGEGGAALVEAGHAQVELGAAGLAGVGVARHPRLGVVVEDGLGALPGGLGGGEVGLGDDGGDALAQLVVPHLGDALVAAAAGVVDEAGLGGEAEAAAEEEGGGGGGGEPAAADGGAGEGGEGVEQRAHGGPAAIGLALEAAHEQRAEAARDGDGDAGGLADEAGEDLGHELGEGVAGEGAAAVGGLEEGDAEGELVGAGVDAGAEELLRGHVGGGAEHDAGDGDRGVEGAEVGDGGGVLGGGPQVVEARGAAGGGLGAGEAEVEDADAAVVADHDVGGLEVAVDEAGGVGGGEALAGLAKHGGELGEGPALALEPGVEGHAVDELHGDVDLAAEGADLVDADDVGVREPGHGLGLAQEAGAGEVLAGLGVEQLDGDLAVELLVVGGIDDAGAAAAELPQDGEAADRGGRGGLLGARGSGEAGAAQVRGEGGGEVARAGGDGGGVGIDETGVGRHARGGVHEGRIRRGGCMDEIAGGCHRPDRCCPRRGPFGSRGAKKMFWGQGRGRPRARRTGELC